VKSGEQLTTSMVATSLAMLPHSFEITQRNLVPSAAGSASCSVNMGAEAPETFPRLGAAPSSHVLSPRVALEHFSQRCEGRSDHVNSVVTHAV